MENQQPWFKISILA